MQEKSSSNRVGGVRDALLWQDQRPVGPLRLPQTRADDFIADFNRIYEGVGMVLNVIGPASAKKILGNANATEDSISDGQVDASTDGGEANSAVTN